MPLLINPCATTSITLISLFKQQKTFVNCNLTHYGWCSGMTITALDLLPTGHELSPGCGKTVMRHKTLVADLCVQQKSRMTLT